MPRQPGKHTSYFELAVAQGQAGCPICRLVFKATDRYLDSILYEAVLDPDVRTKLKRSHGFCAPHVEMLRRKPGRALGVALIYRDIINTIVKVADERHYKRSDSFINRFLGKGRKRPTFAHGLAQERACPVCVTAQEAENSFTELLLAHLDDEKLYSAYADGEGLCLPHLIGALDRVEDEESLQRLIRPQAGRYQLMLVELDEFIRKRDHRFRKEEYGTEGDVWLRAMNAIVGGAGMGLSAKSGGRRSPEFGRENR